MLEFHLFPSFRESNNLKEFFKYLTPSEQDINWGLYLIVAGKAHIQPGSTYPPPAHPAGYYFTWDKGRVLNEYQINYITEGRGRYENNTGKYSIKPGTLVINRFAWNSSKTYGYSQRNCFQVSP